MTIEYNSFTRNIPINISKTPVNSNKTQMNINDLPIKYKWTSIHISITINTIAMEYQ